MLSQHIVMIDKAFPVYRECESNHSNSYYIQSTPDITNPKIPPILFFIKEVLYKQRHTIIHISGQCMNIITCTLQYPSIHTVHIAKHNVTML